MPAKVKPRRVERQKPVNPIPWEERASVSPQEAANILSVSRVTVYHLMHAGELSSSKIRSRRVVMVDGIKRYLSSQTEQTLKKAEAA